MTTPTTIPAYLNEDFILEALDPKGHENLKIKTLKIERNTLGGNYCSDIYRAQVEYFAAGEEVEQKANLLVKDLFASVSDSSQEHFTYEHLLPLMEEILRKAGCERPELSPKLYLARKNPTELHVFEDMCALGYKVCDRYEGFSFEEAKTVVEKLANFHAASMFLLQQQPELVAKLSKYFWLRNPAFPTFVQLIIDENIKHIVPIVEKWAGFEKIAEKLLKNTGAEFERRFFKLFDKEAAKMQVIAHGDLWIKNILVKSVEGSPKVEDAVFIDYQSCFIGSPAFDLQNIFMTSLNLDVLENQREFLIEHYYEQLCRSLKLCNENVENCHVSTPSFEDLQFEMARLEYFTFYALIFSFGQTNLAEELAQDMDYGSFFEPERLARNRLDMFANPRVLRGLKFMLKRLEAKGVLD